MTNRSSATLYSYVISSSWAWGGCEWRNVTRRRFERQLDTSFLVNIKYYQHLKNVNFHGGVWGERRYSSYSFSTSALDGGEWSASRPGRAFTPGERTPVPIVQESGWAKEPVWTQARGKILFSRRGSNPDHPVVQPIVRHYTAWANPAPRKVVIKLIKERKLLEKSAMEWQNKEN
jgi:hypothetical protein